MNDFILQRYYALLDNKESAKEEMEEQDRLLAEKLLRTEPSRRVTRRAPTTARSVKRKTSKREGKAPNTAFNQEHVLSQPLQNVVGSERLSRPQVVKHIWSYIKENGLQDPRDKRKIHCDDKLKTVFKKLLVGMFEMNRLLGDHLFKDEEIVKGEGNNEGNGLKRETDEVAAGSDSEDVKPKVQEDDFESEISDVDD